MCNLLHSGYKPIEEKGIGYKFFLVDKHKNCYGGISRIKYYIKKGSASVQWGDSQEVYHGFCFFLKKPDKALQDHIIARFECFDYYYSKTYKMIMLKIRYKKGLGVFEETKFIRDTVKMALCREFELHEDEVKRGFHL